MNFRVLYAALLCLLVVETPLVSAARRPVHNSSDWLANQVIYEVNVRQFSPEGSLRAVEQALPRIKAMGASIVWLMPVHPIGYTKRKGSLGSYYSVRDYVGVNPEFGTKEDFRSLVKRAHELGLYVILDWVANHTAWDHPWTWERPDFYNRTPSGEFYPPVPGWEDVIDLNYDNPDLREAMIRSMEYWIREFNIDGFRCDVASMVPSDFWAQARGRLNQLKRVFMLAESDSWDLFLNGFDALYGWDLYKTMMKVAAGQTRAEELWWAVQRQRSISGVISRRFSSMPGHFMQFTSNHDENTWNGDLYERLGDASAAFVALSVTLPGLPMIYGGQEAGLNKRLAFFDKDPIQWKDHPFRELYTRLFHLKRTSAALSTGAAGGTLRKLQTTMDHDVMAFVRENGQDRVVTLANLSPRTATFSIPQTGLSGAGAIEILNGTRVEFNDGISFQLKPWGFAVFAVAAP